MNIDFEKSHPAVNIREKRELYQGFVRASIIGTGLIALLLIGLFVFVV
ncbi:MAG: hypothetical protein KKB37_03655 [Alphaproteobacteria bacterium]|nr:hypothetical protein [Alphaproteobacteria bacterium]